MVDIYANLRLTLRLCENVFARNVMTFCGALSLYMQAHQTLHPVSRGRNIPEMPLSECVDEDQLYSWNMLCIS